MTTRYWTIEDGTYGCRECGALVASVEVDSHDVFHARIDRLDWADRTNRNSIPEPDPLACWDCGEPIYVGDDGVVKHVTPSAHGPHGIHFPRMFLGEMTSPQPVERRVRSESEVWTSVAPAGEDYGAPSCAVCGEPVWFGAVLWHHEDRRGDHAATLTPPEPPVGTPVWWDGKWWIKPRAGTWYRPTTRPESDYEPRRYWTDLQPGRPAVPGGSCVPQDGDELEDW
jgi:hypothetical protein